MDSEWIRLANDTLRFQFAPFSDVPLGKRFRRLAHEYMLMAASEFGGPIVLTSDKRKILTLREDDPSIDNICLFTNDGELAQRIRLNNPFQNIIVLLDFLQDELILAVFQRGDRWLIDPCTGEVTKAVLTGLREGELFVEGRVFDNGMVLLTSSHRLLATRHYDRLQCVELANCEEEFADPNRSKLHWVAFPPRSVLSDKIEVHLAHPQAGIVQIVEGEPKRYLFNREKGAHLVESKLPHLATVIFISNFSPNRKLQAFFVAEPVYRDNIEPPPKKKGEKEPPRVPTDFTFKIVVAPAIYSESMEASRFKEIRLAFIKNGVHVNTRNASLPVKLKWCSQKALILQLENLEVYIVGIDGDYLQLDKDRPEKERWAFLLEEADGVRFITRNENRMLRLVPAAYAAVFETFSEHPGALLFNAYQAFAEEKPLQDDEIRKEKEKLAKGVEQCVEAAKFEVNLDQAVRLLKGKAAHAAGVYGKAFLPPNLIPNSIIHETSCAYRAVYQLRQKLRFITFTQFTLLTDERLLKILLRYREHYLAFEFHSFLRKEPAFRTKIFTDWACCKVATSLSDEEVCDQLRAKLEQEPSVSFTQVAHRAIELGRSQLAMMLLDYEPSVAKKVPLLLWIGQREPPETCARFFRRAMDEAVRAHDVELLYSVFRRMLSSEAVPQPEMEEMAAASKESLSALKNFYRMDREVSLVRLLGAVRDPEGVMLEELRLAVTEREYVTKLRLLQLVAEKLKDFQSPLQIEWRRPAFQRQRTHLAAFIEHNPGVKTTQDRVRPVTLAAQLEGFLAKNDGEAVTDMKDAFEISEKRIVLARMKVLIRTAKWEDLLQFFDKHQKKHEIPAEAIADLLFQKNEVIWAMKLLQRMPDRQREQQYLLLQRIGRIREAIDLAADRKDAKALEAIQVSLLDPGLSAYANDKLAALRRK